MCRSTACTCVLYLYTTLYMHVPADTILLEYINLCSHRNASLKQKVKALKKKEAEETQALEEMVLKVESNLQTSTVRTMDVFIKVRQYPLLKVMPKQYLYMHMHMYSTCTCTSCTYI